MYFLSGISSFLGCIETKRGYFKANQIGILWLYELNMSQSFTTNGHKTFFHFTSTEPVHCDRHSARGQVHNENSPTYNVV